MKAYVQNNLAGRSTATNILFYMKGTPPTNPAELTAAVDLSSMSDLHSKCVGASAIMTAPAVDSTGISTYSQTSTLLGAQYSWLKGGAIPVTSVGTQMYAYMPDRAFNADTNIKNDYWHMTPTLFSMPIEAITNTYIDYLVKARDDASASWSGKTGPGFSYQFEYDIPTTISALRVAQGPSVNSNMYIYYADVRYWDGAAWQIAFNATTAGLFNINKSNTVTFTAVTSTKFKITLYPYDVYGTYHSLNLNGVLLMHTSQPTAVAVPDITWGVIVACGIVNAQVTQSGPLGVYCRAAYAPETTDLTDNPNIQINIYGSYFGKITKYMPAIVDTCGQDSLVNKMAISKSVGLLSNDQPTLASYKYYAGDLL